MTAPPFSIGLADTTLRQDPEPYRAAFEQARALAFPDAISVDLLALLQRKLAAASFTQDVVPAIGSRAIEDPPRCGNAVTFALRRRGFLRWMEQATGRGPLTIAEGRLAVTRPDSDDELGWHDDRSTPGRRLGITVALGDGSFSGGEFELRRKREPLLLLRYRPDRAGTVLVFDVAADLEHRVRPVGAGPPRCVFAGWLLAA